MRFATDALVNDNWRNENSQRVSGGSYVADPNRELFESVVRLLAPILDELVFVGGCTTGILVTDPAAGGIRPTKDVDAIVDVTSYAQYAALSDRLRALGLVEDTAEGAPLCRWRQAGVIVDVMPIDEGVLGFSNRWYPMAINTAQRFDIADIAPASSRRHCSSRPSSRRFMVAVATTSSLATISRTSSLSWMAVRRSLTMSGPLIASQRLHLGRDRITSE
jgi:hypothetical protein